MLSFEDIKGNHAVRTYITAADSSLAALGYTEHSFAHIAKARVSWHYLQTFY